MAEVKVRSKLRYSNFPRIEEYLTESHAKGLKYKRKSERFFTHFVFEQCEPQDYTYKFDYREIGDMDDYLALFRDCGWEYAGKFYNFYVFRKLKISGEDDDIFSDNVSKAEMCKTIIKHKYFTRGVAMVALVTLFVLYITIIQNGFGRLSQACLIGLISMFTAIMFQAYIDIKILNRIITEYNSHN